MTTKLIWGIFLSMPIFATQEESYVFVVIDEHSSTETEFLRNQIKNEFSQNADIYISTKDFSDYSSWIYFPLFKKLLSLKEDASWYIFLEERSNLDSQLLRETLKKYDYSKEHFIGKGLTDSSSTIIHHFDKINKSDELIYPDTRSGFVLSQSLLKRLSDAWTPSSSSDFSIDASYELAKYLKSLSVSLVHDENFCIERKGKACATWYTLFRQCEKNSRVLLSDIHIAVKTCSKLAGKRIPILKKTWLKNIPSFGLYSDLQDDKLGTVSLGIPNTEIGHCGKTLEIIRHASKIQGLKWLLIVDDDTLLSTERLSSFLNCFDPSSKISLGQRYGFRTHSDSGFDYPTGGSGMIFSIQLVKLLSEASICNCPSIDSPDDMVLGYCLKNIGVPIIHSSRFHQARPEDYSLDLLEGTRPISFHKFWMIDPIQEYNKWLHNKKLREEL